MMKTRAFLTGVALLCAAATVAPAATAHTTAPTNLTVTGATDSSVSVDWKQDYADDYDGYYIRANGGPRIAYGSSKGTITGLRAGTVHRLCVTIDLAEPAHPDESTATCISAATKAAAPIPTTTPTATPTPAPDPAGFVRTIWTRSDSTTFGRVRSLGFQSVLVNPDRTQLDRALASGLRAGVWLGNYNDEACSWNWSNSTVTTRINAVKGHPAIAYYFVADEPHSSASGGCSTAPQHLTERNALVKSLDPTVPTLITENRREDFAAVGRIADVFGPIRYPCSYSSGCVPAKVTQAIAAVNAAGITSWWGVVQSFEEPASGYYRAPNATELEQIIAAWKAGPGIDGLMAYAWGEACCGDDVGLRDLPGLWPTWQAENSRP
jgi:hypothetical protein